MAKPIDQALERFKSLITFSNAIGRHSQLTVDTANSRNFGHRLQCYLPILGWMTAKGVIGQPVKVLTHEAEFLPKPD